MPAAWGARDACATTHRRVKALHSVAMTDAHGGRCGECALVKFAGGFSRCSSRSRSLGTCSAPVLQSPLSA